MDQMVLRTQQWLNGIYKDNINYSVIPEDGVTGWTTVIALTKALQIELGISTPNGTFGPATSAAFGSLSINSQPQDNWSNTAIISLQNKIFILQGALYCKGYDGGFTGKFTAQTDTAVKKLQTDAGLSNVNGVITSVLMKSLLSMDSFVLLNYGDYNGDPNIRIIQKNLNRDYSTNQYFASDVGLVPCDGIYGRSTNKALLYALQIEEGIPVPNGVFGPATKSNCPVLSVGSTKTKFIYLLQYALYCNGFNPNGFDGQYGNGVKTAVTNFQKFSCLTADGIAGMQTWASLLVSTGDNSRRGIGCDCSTSITPDKANVLVQNGYKIVGRYLTGKFEMTYSEIQTILNAGLSIIPIFEVGGYKLSYFNANQGTKDAYSAVRAAKNLGFPDNAIIYFAVDFDVLDGDITSAILPYFSALQDAFIIQASKYKIGIYAPRNVCSKIAAKGYTCSSFVCDMSTGFSGNLGYPLPKDWAFDQISTITISNSSSSIEIDNNISSGRNNGISNVNSSIEEVVSLIQELDSAALQYLQLNISPYDIASRNKLLHNFLRSLRYNGFIWLATIGLIEGGFTDYLVRYNNQLLKRIDPYIQNPDSLTAYINNKGTDLPHLCATTLGYTSSPVVPDFWVGWGGDLATAMSDVTYLKNLSSNANRTLDSIAAEVIGNNAYTCSRMDIENDIDAIYLANNMSSNTLSWLLNDYYSNVNSSKRKIIFLNSIGFSNIPTEEQLYDTLHDIMIGENGFGYLNSKAGKFLKDKATTTTGIEPTTEVIKSTTLAFARYILNNL